MQKISFIVLGKVQPQGSVRAFLMKSKPGSPVPMRASLTSDNSKVMPWRQQIGWTALEARNKCGWELMPSGVALRLDCAFYLQRPKSAKKDRTWPTVKPDYDKLARAATDALTGVLWADDCQVCQSTIQKKYGSPARAEFTVRVLPPDTQEGTL